MITDYLRLSITIHFNEVIELKVEAQALIHQKIRKRELFREFVVNSKLLMFCPWKNVIMQRAMRTIGGKERAKILYFRESRGETRARRDENQAE